MSDKKQYQTFIDEGKVALVRTIHRLLARKMRGYADAQAGRVFRDLIDMPATVTVSPIEVLVQFHRRSHLPIIIDSGLRNRPVCVPWWNGATLRMVA
jgi:hypothetical protein